MFYDDVAVADVNMRCTNGKVLNGGGSSLDNGLQSGKIHYFNTLKFFWAYIGPKKK